MSTINGSIMYYILPKICIPSFFNKKRFYTAHNRSHPATIHLPWRLFLINLKTDGWLYKSYPIQQVNLTIINKEMKEKYLLLQRIWFLYFTNNTHLNTPATA